MVIHLPLDLGVRTASISGQKIRISKHKNPNFKVILWCPDKKSWYRSINTLLRYPDFGASISGFWCFDIQTVDIVLQWCFTKRTVHLMWQPFSVLISDTSIWQNSVFQNSYKTLSYKLLWNSYKTLTKLLQNTCKTCMRMFCKNCDTGSILNLELQRQNRRRHILRCQCYKNL